MAFAREARRLSILAARIHLDRLAEQGAHEEEAGDEEGQEPLHEVTWINGPTPLLYKIRSVLGKGSSSK